MNVRNILSVGFAAIALVAIPAFSATTCAQSMNGTWEVTSGTLYGKPIPANVAFTMTLQVADNTFVAESGNLSSSGEISANPQANLKEVTFKINNGDDPGRELKGIYKFEGQSMTITFSEDDQIPSSFDSTAENKYLTLNYQIGTGRNAGGIAQNRNRQPAQNATAPPKANLNTGNQGAAAF